MADPTSTMIPTITCLATTTSLTPLPTATADATTEITTGSFLITIEMNYTMPPLTTSPYAKKNPEQILTSNEDNDAHNVLYPSIDGNYNHATYQGMPENKDDDHP